MKSNLETFVKENRDAFDTLEPTSTVWNSINSRITRKNGAASKISWLKTFVFGASIVTGIIIVTNFTTNNKDEKSKINKNVDTILINSETQEEKSVQKNDNNKVAINIPVSSVNIVPDFMFIPENKTENLKTIFSQVYPNLEYPIEEKKPAKTLTINQSDICQCGNKFGIFILNDTIFNGIKEIEICSFNADINIIGGEDEKTYLDFEYISPAEKNKKKIVKIEQNKIFYEILGSKLTISVKSGEKTYINKGFNSIKQMKLDLRIPVSSLLSIRNGNGDISVKNIINSQSLIDNSNGDIKLSDLNSDLQVQARMGDLEIIHSQGKLNIEGGLGTISIFDFTGNIISNSSNGDTKISTIKGNLSINSSLGDQEFKSISGNTSTHSTSGDINFYDCNGNIEVESSLGDQFFQNIKGNLKSNSNSGDLKILNMIGDLDLSTELGNTNIEEQKGNLSIKSSSYV